MKGKLSEAALGARLDPGSAADASLWPSFSSLFAFARQRSVEVLALDVAGMRAGYYLCFFGMHILTPAIFERLQYAIDHDLREKGEFQFTSAQEALRASGERYLAFEAVGDRLAHRRGVGNRLFRAAGAGHGRGHDRVAHHELERGG